MFKFTYLLRSNHIFYTPLQAGAYTSNEPSWLQMMSICELFKDIVSIFGSWSLELTKSLMIFPERTFPSKMTIYLSIFNLLMEEWVWYNVNGSLIVTYYYISCVSPLFYQLRSFLSHVIKHEVSAIVRHSTSKLDLAFLLLQEMTFPPPQPGAFFMYWRMRSPTSQWLSYGVFWNWLTTLTAHVMFGLVILR